MGRQVIAQKQMWHGTDLPHLGLGLLRVHGGEGGEVIHGTRKNELVLLGLFFL